MSYHFISVRDANINVNYRASNTLIAKLLSFRLSGIRHKMAWEGCTI